MDALTPVRLGWRVTTGALGLAVSLARGAADEVLDRVFGHEDEAPPAPVTPMTPRTATRPAPPPPAPAPPPAPERSAVEELTQLKTVDDTPVLVESEGGGSAGAELHVDPPWDGYDQMRAVDIVDRLVLADAAEKAVVRLYEAQHKGRRSVLAAAS